MASFNTFLPILLNFEGGFVDDPADPGGATNMGITLQTFSGCAQNLFGFAPTLDSLRTLTDVQAGAIYNALYWNTVRGDDIALQDLANIVCDFYVNAGVHATKLLQNLLNEQGARLDVDGVIGPAVVQVLAAIDQQDLYRRYKAGRIAYYHDLVQREPSLGKFLPGWLNRVNAFPDV